ncbi:molybdopterin biosynthesis protein [Siccirubricoccus sp. KC 17139]|uniref:Molybdopterin molybdenumtransferase n=1 Tax=Siccirubricoccus soli TaxID=2899147 RepID=A0ABT1D115_9PROT|nr:molybdopterin biosynthesis protein [Siccirubricoccus soli]MCP2681090.1 molybdopterin-binding protein [Siccirubricoccus soli]
MPLRLTAPEAALARLLALAPTPVAPLLLPVAEALGLVLAEDLRTAAPVPPVPVARRDGYAVAAAETLGAGPYAPLPLATPPRAIGIGDPLPPGCDAVLPGFDLLPDPPFPQALQPAAPWDGVRRPGEEIAAGTRLRAAGEVLAPRDLPALAALGLDRVAVRRPRLGWIATGAEMLADPARDRLRPLTAALAPEAALRPLPPVPDAPDAIAATLRAAAPAHDLLILAGGTGEGQADDSAAGLAAAGRLVLHGLGTRPGMTAGFGEVAGRPVLLLPGQQEDAIAALLLLGRPLLARLAAARPAAPRRLRLTRKIASAVGLAEWVPLREVAPGQAEPLAVGSLPAAALAAAAALLLVPPESEGFEAGAEVAALPW